VFAVKARTADGVGISDEGEVRCGATMQVDEEGGRGKGGVVDIGVTRRDREEGKLIFVTRYVDISCKLDNMDRQVTTGDVR
jgi:hypothetical protein